MHACARSHHRTLKKKRLSERIEARKPGRELRACLLRQAAQHLVAGVDVQVEPEVPESLNDSLLLLVLVFWFLFERKD